MIPVEYTKFVYAQTKKLKKMARCFFVPSFLNQSEQRNPGSSLAHLQVQENLIFSGFENNSMFCMKFFHCDNEVVNAFHSYVCLDFSKEVLQEPS